ncbi:MAG TPA: hypothetical protein VJT13_03685 [Xanthobacteraceae bacterium]|nr:hypothetical protein [Xanthobacteraceae bacterium]
MKALLFAAIAVDVLASLYLALIAPIMIYGWNNTTFNGGVALVVAALLALGIGGPILGLIWRNARPRAALWAAGVPALAVVVGCIFVTLD